MHSCLPSSQPPSLCLTHNISIVHLAFLRQWKYFSNSRLDLWDWGKKTNIDCAGRVAAAAGLDFSIQTWDQAPGQQPHCSHQTREITQLALELKPTIQTESILVGDRRVRDSRRPEPGLAWDNNLTESTCLHVLYSLSIESKIEEEDFFAENPSNCDFRAESGRVISLCAPNCIILDVSIKTNIVCRWGLISLAQIDPKAVLLVEPKPIKLAHDSADSSWAGQKTQGRSEWGEEMSNSLPPPRGLCNWLDGTRCWGAARSVKSFPLVFTLEPGLSWSL